MRTASETEAAEGIIAMAGATRATATQGTAAQATCLKRKVNGLGEDVNWLLNIIDSEKKEVSRLNASVSVAAKSAYV